MKIIRCLTLIFLFMGFSLLNVSAQGSRFAARFYGKGTGQIDRIKIPLASSPLLNVGSNFTISFWMKAEYEKNAGTVQPGQNGDGWITGNIIIDRDVYGAGDYGDYGVSIGRSAGRNVLAFGLHNGNWGQTIVGTNHVGDGSWHFVAITRQASNGLMQIFVDGALDAQGTGPTGNVSYRVGRATSWPNSDPYLVIAAEKHDAGSEYPSFNGYIDELRIWSRVLSSNELKYVSSKIIPPDESPEMVSWFRLEEGTNRALRDCVSGYTGTLFSGVSGIGEWTSWQQGSNAAPIQLYQPSLFARAENPQNLMISWYAPENISFNLEATDSLLPPVSWSPVPSFTNLSAANTRLIVTNTATEERRFFRVRGVPYR